MKLTRLPQFGRLARAGSCVALCVSFAILIARFNWTFLSNSVQFASLNSAETTVRTTAARQTAATATVDFDSKSRRIVRVSSEQESPRRRETFFDQLASSWHLQRNRSEHRGARRADSRLAEAHYAHLTHVQVNQAPGNDTNDRTLFLLLPRDEKKMDRRVLSLVSFLLSFLSAS